MTIPIWQRTFRLPDRKVSQPLECLAYGPTPGSPSWHHGEIGNHSFRAIGIAAELNAGGALEHALGMAAHSVPKTTKIYDRTSDEVSLDEVERTEI